MPNIEVQICGLVLDLLLIYFFIKHERVGLHSERLFDISLAVNTACIVLDIFSVVGIVYEEQFTKVVVVALCKMYLISLILASGMGFVYAYSDVMKLRENRKFRYAQYILMGLGVISVAILPLKYYGKDRIVYSYGYATDITYVFALLFIVSALLCTFLYGRHMNPHRRNAVRSWMILEMMAGLFQYNFPQLLLVGFASSIGMVILYSELENPDEKLDRVTGTFSYNALSDYMKQLYSLKKPYSCIFICGGDEWKLDREEERIILVEISEYLHLFPDAKLFRGMENDFILIYEGKEEEAPEERCSANLKTIKERFKGSWEGRRRIEPSFIYIPNGSIADSPDEFFSIYAHYREGLGNHTKSLVLGEKEVHHIREYRKMRKIIRQAIEEDRVEVYYQPIYSIQKDKFVSAEALARLRNTDGSIVMPGKFIPVAEEYGMIEEIGEIVFEKTCRALKETALCKMGIEYIEVNLSVAQCENVAFADNYHDIMERMKLSPETINLEITETSSLNHRNVLIDNMHSLKNAGCSFSLDDFGTGESNLNYIIDMPVDIIKFDRTMTQEYFVNQRAKIVMNATVRLIKELGLRIVAEGIETKEQLDSMAELGIDYIQGYYFSRPLPHEEFLGFIEARNRV